MFFSILIIFLCFACNQSLKVPEPIIQREVTNSSDTSSPRSGSSFITLSEFTLNSQETSSEYSSPSDVSLSNVDDYDSSDSSSSLSMSESTNSFTDSSSGSNSTNSSDSSYTTSSSDSDESSGEDSSSSTDESSEESDEERDDEDISKNQDDSSKDDNKNKEQNINYPSLKMKEANENVQNRDKNLFIRSPQLSDHQYVDKTEANDPPQLNFNNQNGNNYESDHSNTLVDEHDEGEGECPSAETILKKLETYDIDVQRPIWHSYTYNTGTYNREELRIKEVVTKKTLSLDKQIYEWVSIGNSAAGRGPRGLTVITSHQRGILTEHHDLNEHVSAMCIFQWWNQEEHSLSTGLVTAQDATINWHHLGVENQLTQLWSWQLHEDVCNVNVFKLQDKWKVAVTQESAQHGRSVSIYGMELWDRWWFEQRLEGHGKVTVINYGKLLAVPLADSETISIYKYDFNEKRYFHLKNITSPEVMEVSAFTAGALSFLAVGGERPAIFQVRGDQLVEKPLLNYQLEHVELWLPIPLGYYRNDVILLFQHKLDHYSHSSSVLEALQWNGKAFVLLEHSPCRSHEEEMFGFSCILDAEGEKGLKGAAVFRTQQGEVGVLTASEEFTPIMFEIKTELVKVQDPVDHQLERILSVMKSLQDRFIAQQKVIDKARRILHKDIHRDTDYIEADNWKIKELRAPAIHFDGNLKDFLGEKSQVTIAGMDLKDINLNTEVSRLFDQIKDNQNKMKTVVERLKNAVMKEDGIPESLDRVKIKGQINVRGNVVIKNGQIGVINDLNVDRAMKSSVKKNKDNKLVIEGKTIVKNLQADHLNVNIFNGIDLVNLNKNRFKALVVDGDLEMVNHLIVLNDVHLGESGTLNNINLKTDVYTTENKNKRDDRFPGFLSFDSIRVRDRLKVEGLLNDFRFTEEGLKRLVDENASSGPEVLEQQEMTLDSLVVGKDLMFENVNGKSWKAFADGIVMKSEKVLIDNLHVDGKVEVDRGFSMDILNELPYPQDYFLLNESSPVIFTGAKTFSRGLDVEQMDCGGTVSGIRPEDIVTLTTKQNLANFTFFDLTVTEKMDVGGEIMGKELDDFLSNPILTDTDHIKSNVIFRNLKVKGNLLVQNKLNGTHWNGFFEDIIMKTDQPVVIDSLKAFDGDVFVEKGLTVQSGFINDKRLKEFLTLDTDQQLETVELNGNIIFEKLQVGGMFDGVNVTDLNENSVKLSGDQSINADLSFIDVPDYTDDYDSRDLSVSVPLRAANLEVLKLCNDWRVNSDAVFIDSEEIVLNSPEFDILTVDHLIVEGNLETDTVSGLNLHEFDNVRLSKTEDRIVTAPYTIADCKINQIDFNFLNECPKQDLDTIIRQYDNIHKEINLGNVELDTLQVSGKLDVAAINDVDLRKLANEAVWLKEDNQIDGNVKFLDKVFMKNLQLKNDAETNFVNFINDIVQSGDDEVILTGKKTYVNGLHVGDIKVDYINGVSASNLLTVHTNQTIEGNVHILGNLTVDYGLHVEGLVNGENMNQIHETFTYLDNDEYNIKGDVFLEEGTGIDNLVVYGLINDVYNPQQILDSVIWTHDDNTFENSITFSKPVTVKKNLDVVNNFNGIHLKSFIDDVVLVNEDAIVDSVVEFTAPVVVHGNLQIQDLQADTVQGCSLHDWADNAVYLDQRQQITGFKTFHNITIHGDAAVKFINEKDMEDIITLGSDQVIAKSLRFKSVSVDSEFNIKGLVNSVKLDEEVKNTLMVDDDQIIESPIHFHSNVFIKNDAHLGKVNSGNLDNIVSLDSDQMLMGNYRFHGNTYFENDLNITGLLSGVDLQLWMRNAVFRNDYGENTIKGNWNVNGDVYFKSNIEGTDSITGINIHQIMDFVNNKKINAECNENNLMSTYKNLCTQLNYLADASNKQMYIFKSFKEIQTISCDDLVDSLHFDHEDTSYIIISKKDDCGSELWRWNISAKSFEKTLQVETGCVVKWHLLQRGKSSLLLTQTGQYCRCRLRGTGVWYFDGNTLLHINDMPPVEVIHTPSNDQGSFFTIMYDIIYKHEIDDRRGKPELIQSASWPIANERLKIFPYKSDAGLTLTNGWKLFGLPERPGEVVDVTRQSGFFYLNDRLVGADEALDLHVGRNGRKLTAAVWSNKSSQGAITIYEDISKGKILQKITCDNPSSLTVLQLDGYQTLLLFAESSVRVQVYSYHGFQGFKHLQQVNVPARSIQVSSTIARGGLKESKSVIITTDDTIRVLQISMYGDHNHLNLYPCNL